MTARARPLYIAREIESRSGSGPRAPTDRALQPTTDPTPHPRKRIQRQPKSHRRIARNQIHPLRPEKPRSAHPRCPSRPSKALAPQRQRPTDDLVQPARKPSPAAPALPDFPACSRTDRHSPAIAALSTGNTRHPHTPVWRTAAPRPAAWPIPSRSAERPAPSHGLSASFHPRPAPDRSRSAGRPSANKPPAPSAAAIRPDTISPARDAEILPARNDRAAAGSANPRSYFFGPSAVGSTPAVHVVDRNKRRLAAHRQRTSPRFRSAST
jgi:hypothetical protein